MFRRIISSVGSSSGVGLRLEHRRDGEQHGGQRGAELVAEHGEEPVLGLAGGLGQLFGFAQVFLGPLAIGDVFDDERAEHSLRARGFHRRERGGDPRPGSTDSSPGYSNRTGRPVDRHSRNRSIQVSIISAARSAPGQVSLPASPVATPKNLSVSALAETKRVSSSVSSMTPMAITDDS